MRANTVERENRRLVVQAELDGAKRQAERNRMGQFATPPGLARQMLEYAKGKFGGSQDLRFLDPAIGTGAFYSALLTVFAESDIRSATGYEVDGYYGEPCSQLWKGTALDLRLEDFTRASQPPDREKFNLLICNPPYVRHHHIDGQEKKRLRAATRKACGIEMNGLAGLYCYFLGLSHQWMADDALAGWLIPSEFMDVNYGASVKRYLLEQVDLLQIHRFDPEEVQFGDALVSSCVVWFINRRPTPHRTVRMSYGGSLLNPRQDRPLPRSELERGPKWTRCVTRSNRRRSGSPVLADLFDVRRGLVTGGNRYFILLADEIEERQLPAEVFRPILPSPRHIRDDEVLADEAGIPAIERPLFLLDCRLDEEEIEHRYPALMEYLLEGRALGIADRYICRHRSPWYSQERRPPAPFLCTYLGRIRAGNGRPFRFLLNHSAATAPNVYLMLYPKRDLEQAIHESPSLKRRIWEHLNSIEPEALLNEGRVYGGGLYKLEPKELARVPVPALAELLSESRPAVPRENPTLF